MPPLSVKRLLLRNYRNVSELECEFSPAFNRFIGENAQGKTNVLEALYLCVTGRAFRTHHLGELIGPYADGFYLEADFYKHGILQRIRIACQGKCQGDERRIFYNHTALPSLVQLLGVLPGVLLAPEDSQLVKGPPALRRDYLDLQIAQSNPLYVHHMTRYSRAMRHRNHLLRTQQSATIEQWETEMAHSAAYLMHQRMRAIEDLSGRARLLQEGLSGLRDALELTYRASIEECLQKPEQTEAFCRQAWARLRPREFLIGSTLIGPHKDDMAIFVNGREARQFASEGQQRSVVSALKLAEWQRLKDLTEETPLMIIDDIGLGLDEQRRENLYKSLRSLGQVFLSSPLAQGEGEGEGRDFPLVSGRLAVHP